MRRVIFGAFYLICLAGAAASQSTQASSVKHWMIATPECPNIQLSARSIERHGSTPDVIELKGDVEIRTKDMSLRSDEAAYNVKTAEIKAIGNVRVQVATQH